MASVGCRWVGWCFRWDPFPGAGAASVGVAAVGFLVVVPGAEAGQGFDAGVAGFDVGAAVIDLEVSPYLTAGDDALGVAAFEDGALVGSDVAPGVGHGDDVDAFGEDDLEDGVVGYPAGHRDRDRPDAGDFAAFPVDGVAPHEGVVVDPHVD